jgi:hypothetical protein
MRLLLRRRGGLAKALEMDGEQYAQWLRQRAGVVAKDAFRVAAYGRTTGSLLSGKQA